MSSPKIQKLGCKMGTYRCALKAPDRLAVRMATRVGGAGGYQHYQKYQERGIAGEMPVAIVLGCPPYVAFMDHKVLPIGVDEPLPVGLLVSHYQRNHRQNSRSNNPV